MTQFASTLYPQTNPSNPVLLNFREYAEGRVAWLAAHWTSTDEMWSWMVLNDDNDEHMGNPEQEEHARRVLTRLANLSG